MSSTKEYLTILKIINYAKINDWKNAYYYTMNEIGNDMTLNTIFLNNLKKIFLCCFLLSINYSSIKIDYLIGKFELPKETIIEVINNMIKGISPVENIPIEFKGSLFIEKNFIQIHDQNTQHSFSGYNELINIKLQYFKRSLDSYNPTKLNKTNNE